MVSPRQGKHEHAVAEARNLGAPRFFRPSRFTDLSSLRLFHFASTTTTVKMADPASSRIFIKGLPPTLTDAEFRKHFSQNGREITDAKIFQTRRIGYIGYKTPEDAQKAVKYFNKTFMRMSRIGVEIARPAKAADQQQSSHAPTARRKSAERAPDAGLKRKRDSELVEKSEDPKLKEFMDVMRPKSKKKAWENESLSLQTQDHKDERGDAVMPEDGQSDEEYEEVPRKKKRSRSKSEVESANTEHAAVEDDNLLRTAEEGNDEPEAHLQEDEEELGKPATSDADWARSKTSRLLGLLDDDEEAAEEAAADDPESEEEATEKGAVRPKPENSIPTPPSDEQPDDNEAPNVSNPDVEAVRSSMRLFVRNLPYDVKEEDLEADFASYGNLEEVRLR